MTGILVSSSSSWMAAAQPSTIPVAINALFVDGASGFDENALDTCGNGNVLNNTDPNCQVLGPCHVTFSESGQHLEYLFYHTPEQDIVWVPEPYPYVIVDITLRVFSPGNTSIRLEVEDDVPESGEGGELGPIVDLDVNGDSAFFQDVTWYKVQLEDYNLHRLTVAAPSGVDLCSIKITNHVQVPYIPFAINANEKLIANGEVDTARYGNCFFAGPPPHDLNKPDAQLTQLDSTCQALGICHIAFTQPGEWLFYNFRTTDEDIIGMEDGSELVPVNIIVRVASYSSSKRIWMQVADQNELGMSDSFSTPGLGYQTFQDIVWPVNLQPVPIHSLRIEFPGGNVNLCSIRVEPIMTNPVVPSIPFSVNALDYHDASERSGSITGNCQVPIFRYGVDAQLNADPTCQELGPCNIANAQPGDSVLYDFETSPSDIVASTPISGDTWTGVYVDITVRVASFSSTKKIILEVFQGYEPYDPYNRGQAFSTPGNGYHAYEEITWRMVELALPRNNANTQHSLQITFPEGNVNLCSVAIVPSIHTPPITWPALDFFGNMDLVGSMYYGWYYDTTPEHFGTCGEGPVDGQPTSDEICISRDGADCNIAFTDPGEYVEYLFYIPPGGGGTFDIWARVAAQSSGRTIDMELVPVGMEESFDIPAHGWQNFEDVVWRQVPLGENYFRLRIRFVTGSVNVCSVGLRRSPVVSRDHLVAPGLFSALMYIDHDENTPERYGLCPDGGPVDAQVTTDAICQEALSEFEDFSCNIGFTEAGEFVTYAFETDGQHEYINLSFRIASAIDDTFIRVEFTKGNGTPWIFDHRSPDDGWQAYETVTWEKVYIGPRTQHSVTVNFLTGNVNLCAFGVEYYEE
jgi:hypothetical protein